MDFLGKILSAEDLINKRYVDEAIPTNISELFNDAGYITGIDKSMVASAVGSSGNAGKVLSSTGGDLGWVSLPTSLPASDVYAWAKKSSLALADVPNLSSKYLSVNGGTLTGGLTISSGNFVMSGSDTVTKQLYAIADNTYALGTGSRRWSNIYTVLINDGTPIHSGNIGSQHVAGLIKSDGNAYVSYNATYGYANINGVAIGSNSNTIERVTSGKLYIQKNVTEATIINQYGGYVGVGTDNPAEKLDVNGNIQVSTSMLLYSGTSNPYIRFKLNGNVWYCQAYTTNGTDGIFLGSTSSKSLKVDASGNVYCPQNLIIAGDTATGSDIRFKDRIADHRIALESIANAPLFTFKWNDREDDSVHLGSSAQYWEKVAPWLVKGEDFKTLDYSTLGVAIGISLANKTLNHEERIKILEKENEQLKEQIRRINYGN